VNWKQKENKIIMNNQKYKSWMMHLPIAVAIGIGLNWGYKKWVAKKEE
jgi:hypothetical protein